MKQWLIKALAFALVSQCLGEEGWNQIWEDDFQTFDYNKWQHEITAWGGGVSTRAYKCLK